MKNLDAAIRQSGPTNPQFEIESPDLSADGAGPDISYGLNLRNSGDSDSTRVSVDAVMLQKLRQDLRDLPDGPGMDDYEDMPVEGFGAALLAGYGWHEGKGIGRNAKEDVKIVQYDRRTAKEGLGFIADMPSVNEKKEKSGKRIREGEEREEVLRFHVGKLVRIIGGRVAGLKGRVLEIKSGGDSVILRLSKSHEELKVKIHDIADLGSVEEERCLRKLNELKIRGSNDHRESKENRRESKRDGDQRRRSEQRETIRATPQVRWLTNHIRVRVISKDLKSGRLYLKKGEVVDVVGPTACDISMDENGELVQGVDQDLLETALPRRGGPVLVLYGKHKGVYGSLVEKDMERENGVVRDADTHAMLNVSLEQIAEYTGDPALIGY